MENNVVEIPEEDRSRRRSIKNEIEKMAAERAEAIQAKEKVKEFSKANLFPELQKAVSQKEEEDKIREENKKKFSHDVLSQLPKAQD